MPDEKLILQAVPENWPQALPDALFYHLGVNIIVSNSPIHIWVQCDVSVTITIEFGRHEDDDTSRRNAIGVRELGRNLRVGRYSSSLCVCFSLVFGFFCVNR